MTENQQKSTKKAEKPIHLQDIVPKSGKQTKKEKKNDAKLTTKSGGSFDFESLEFDAADYAPLDFCSLSANVFVVYYNLLTNMTGVGLIFIFPFFDSPE